MQCIAQEVKRSFHSEYNFVDGDLWHKMQPRMMCTASYLHVDIVKCGCSFCPVLEYIILRGDSLLPSGHYWAIRLHKSQLELDRTNSLARATMGAQWKCPFFSVLLPTHLLSSKYNFWSTEAGFHFSGLLFAYKHAYFLVSHGRLLSNHQAEEQSGHMSLVFVAWCVQRLCFHRTCAARFCWLRGAMHRACLPIRVYKKSSGSKVHQLVTCFAYLR